MKNKEENESKKANYRATGWIFKDIRETLGLTQKKFAESLGVTRGVIAQIESGNNKPTIKIIESLARNYETQLYKYGNRIIPYLKDFASERKIKSTFESKIHELLGQKILDRQNITVKESNQNLDFLKEGVEDQIKRIQDLQESLDEANLSLMKKNESLINAKNEIIDLQKQVHELTIKLMKKE